ncbi:MAG: amine oxidase [Chloroflexi bacterium]|nr:amine oxidase [Chloroflexota bacterium]|tara:strand:+ start:505 stop:1830 length:1326 start_codon:yes stop_codon:yes gene_type:complete
MKIAVIGAGAAGLSAAYDLINYGHSVDVFESSYFVGGQASTIEVGGSPLERGYHHLFTTDYHIIELMNELSIKDSLVWYKSSVGTYSDGKLYKTTTPIDLMTLSLLPFMERIRLGFFTLSIKKIKDWNKLENITANEWLQNNLGGDAYSKLWEPLLRSKFGKYYDQIGMPWFWSKIQTRFASRKFFKGEVLGYPVGSFDTIFNKLTEYINRHNGKIFLEHQVKKIHPSIRQKFNLDINTKDGEITRTNYDYVLATVPSFEFPKLISLPKNYKKLLDSVKYLAAVVLILEIKEKLTDYYWLNIADTNLPFLGIIEHTNLINKDFYNGNTIVYITNYLDREDYVYSLDKNDLLDYYLPHLKMINNKFDKSWIRDFHYNSLSAAQPIITTGYSSRIPSHETPYEKLYLANTTQIYPEDRGTNYSIKIGRQIAKTINMNISLSSY